MIKISARYFVLPMQASADGNRWTWIAIGPDGISAFRCGVWRSGWDMPQVGVAFQPGLEPSEGFAR